MKKNFQYTIFLTPVTKKNSQRILFNRTTGRRFVAPSEKYTGYAKNAMRYLEPKPRTPIDFPCRVKTVFYMPTKRNVDLSNLIEAAHDVLVTAKVIKDDNAKIIKSVDGSRVLYDKKNPRTEIFIEEVKDEPLL